jgi:hypothetical protein
LGGFTDHRIVSAMVRPGHRARVIDVSAHGALIETHHRLLPGAAVELQVQNSTSRTSVKGRVVRCAVVRLRSSSICYRGAIAFDRHLPWFIEECRERSTPQVI